jgi:hypothetical protein
MACDSSSRPTCVPNPPPRRFARLLLTIPTLTWPYRWPSHFDLKMAFSPLWDPPFVALDMRRMAAPCEYAGSYSQAEEQWPDSHNRFFSCVFVFPTTAVVPYASS